MTYTETIPTASVETLRKLAEKINKNVPEFNVTFGKPYDKVYIHDEIVRHDVVGKVKMWHNVTDIEITIPDVKEWSLLATIEDGILYVTDPRQKIDFKNGHGADYHTCDICGKSMYKKMFIVRHTDGREMQIGGGCVKKFGLNVYATISMFTNELYKLFRLDVSDEREIDGEHEWLFNDDKLAFRALNKIDLIRATYAYYKEKGVWEKSHYEYGETKRPAQDACEYNYENKIYGCTEEYAQEICEYGKTLENKSEFASEMINVANNYYSKPTEAVYAWFLIKSYEDSKGVPTFQEGEYIKVIGKLVASRKKEGYFGDYTENTILTDTGLRVIRNGSVATNDDKRVCLYAQVKFQRGSDIFVGRMTKNLKKGLTAKNI